jgi:hypothetical protein
MVFEGDKEANPMAIPVLAEPGDVSGARRLLGQTHPISD